MKLRESLPLKIAAIILSFITAMAALASVFGIFFMLDESYYSKTRADVRDEVLKSRAYQEVYSIYEQYDWKGKPSGYAEKRGIYYLITDSYSGAVIETNYRNQEYLALARVDDFEVYEYDENENRYTQNGHIDITVYIPDTKLMSVADKTVLRVTDLLYTLRFHMIWISLVSILLTVILLCYLYAAAGHRSGGETKLNFLDKIPLDIVTAGVAALAVISAILIDAAVSTTLLYGAVILVLTVSADYLIALGYTMTLATRLKTETVIKNNISYKLIRLAWKYVKRFFGFFSYIIKGLPLVVKTVIICILMFIIWFFITLRVCYNMNSIIFMLLIGGLLALFAVAVSIIMQRIKEGGEKIASGELNHKIDTKYMFGDFKAFAESLNNINEGLSNAVNEKMKSERFKTELITNVSHDIKTPLTSIINYVDLIKKENCENEKVGEYIAVLDRQSARLKKLTEDLVEASKASTGNLAVNLTECEVGVLLSQTVGEFCEKLASAELTPILNQPEKPIKISADGRHLWRVFDNLMNNACKYSLKGTRVYLDVMENDGNAVITFRNISAFELNVSSDELMERFVRGDKSRGTEGSGLGLSIAKSLTELQNGKFDIKVDGDLFKVTLIFPTI